MKQMIFDVTLSNCWSTWLPGGPLIVPLSVKGRGAIIPHSSDDDYANDNCSFLCFECVVIGADTDHHDDVITHIRCEASGH